MDLQTSSWKELVDMSEDGRATHGAPIEAMRRVTVALKSQEESVTRFGKQLWAYTVSIALLTLAIILNELHIIPSFR